MGQHDDGKKGLLLGLGYLLELLGARSPRRTADVRVLQVTQEDGARELLISNLASALQPHYQDPSPLERTAVPCPFLGGGINRMTTSEKPQEQQNRTGEEARVGVSGRLGQLPPIRDDAGHDEDDNLGRNADKSEKPGDVLQAVGIPKVQCEIRG
jgi:hypothetical protein